MQRPLIQIHQITKLQVIKPDFSRVKRRFMAGAAVAIDVARFSMLYLRPDCRKVVSLGVLLNAKTVLSD